LLMRESSTLFLADLMLGTGYTSSNSVLEQLIMSNLMQKHIIAGKSEKINSYFSFF